MQWKKLSRDDYQSVDGRFKITRMPAWANAYANRDQWTLIYDNDAVDVYDRLRDAKEIAENIKNGC